MSNAMRTGKRWLAGVAAGALGAGLLSIVGAPSASATVYSVPLAFPSMTIISTAPEGQVIPFATQTNGTTGAITNTSVTATLTNSAGVSWIGTDDTRFTVGVSSVTAGVGAITLGVGTGVSTFANITPGTYTLTAILTDTATGVGLASSSMPIAIVNGASAGSVAGSATFVDDTVWADAAAVTSETVATDDTINGTSRDDSYIVQFTNSAGGPIVAPLNMFSASAGLNKAGTRTSLDDSVAYLTQPGVYSFSRLAAVTGNPAYWQSTAGSGTVVANFASPINQITKTLPVSITAAATLGTLDITSAVSGSALAVTASPQPDDSLVVQAGASVKFTVSGVTSVGGTARAGVPVTFTAQPVSGSNSTAGTPVSYSAISPALATTVTSGTGGAVSLEYTVTNAVATQGVRITASYPSNPTATKTYFVQFALGGTPTTLLVPAANVTAANSGTVVLGATLIDAFSQPVKDNPVRVTVAGVAPNATGTILTTNATGQVSYTITVPAGTLAGAASVATFSAWNGSAYSTTAALQKQTTVSYTAGSAAVSALTVRGSFAGNATSYTALTDNQLNTAINPMYVNTATNLAAAYTPAADGYAWKVQATATNASAATLSGVPVTITMTEGGKVQSPTTGLWVDTATVFTDTNGQVTAVLTSTKTGEISYSLTSGTVTSTVKAHYANRPTDARNVTLTASSTSVPAGDGVTLIAEVKDRFGNAVPGVVVTFAETGPGYIAGTGLVTTSAAGRAEGTLVTVAGLNGVSAITATVASLQTVSMPGALPSAARQVPVTVSNLTLQTTNLINTVTNYNTWPATDGLAATSFTVAGVSAAVGSAAVAVEVSAGGSKSISITGSRVSVGGKPGIQVDGVVSGIDNGKTVIPYFRFPGETTFAQGSARPVIEQGAFTWQRKTGKKFYAYVTNDDGAVTSNRVVIAAN